jgi:hypothetical protein
MIHLDVVWKKPEAREDLEGAVIHSWTQHLRLVELPRLSFYSTVIICSNKRITRGNSDLLTFYILFDSFN